MDSEGETDGEVSGNGVAGGAGWGRISRTTGEVATSLRGVITSGSLSGPGNAQPERTTEIASAVNPRCVVIRVSLQQ